MNKTKLKDGIARIAGAILVFSAPALVVTLVFLILVVVIVAVSSVLTNDIYWKWLTTVLKAVVKLIALGLGSFSVTQWILILMVWVAWKISGYSRKILAKLEDIESELRNLISSARTGSYHDDDIKDL